MRPFSFVVATPGRSVCDDHARALSEAGLLRLYCINGRRGTKSVPLGLSRWNFPLALLTYTSARLFPSVKAESFRFRLHPLFDNWVKKQLLPGDSLISSYGYTNACFRFVRRNGGRTFVDAGNSHPRVFWNLLADEHNDWNVTLPPIPVHHYRRALSMMDDTDYILSPSTFVSNSYRSEGFPERRIFHVPYALDLSTFVTDACERKSDRPLTIVNTGSLSLRKGTPYLLEAFRQILREVPNARLLLTSSFGSLEPTSALFRGLPIEWAPPLPHTLLAKRLQQGDIFVLPSIEDGFARTVTEALACGCFVVTTPNTGASDYITPGENGAIVPIRNARAISAAVLKIWKDIQNGARAQTERLRHELSYDSFKSRFLAAIESVISNDGNRSA